ncbi:MAG TPA: hypothetical protein VGI21_24500 [Streptosporangiaceae bacterium]|jgi:hypothetical protein
MADSYKANKIKANHVAFGKNAMIDARVRTAPDGPQRAYALDRIERLLKLLEKQEGEIPEAGPIRADAEALQGALKKKKLNRKRIESLIHGITAGAAEITALANAADAIHAAVMKLFS